jgi:SAM-dependent methyltransferase
VPKIDEVNERERAFFDELWRRTPLQRIEEPLDVPGVDLRGKRVLICSCGTGEDPVRAARGGAAEVATFDISEVAVAKAREVAAFNGVEVDARVMDFHALEYPADHFDVIYGLAILHHVDCERVGREIHRCLKPGGVAMFWENSDRNPVLRLARRALFGSPGQRQRKRFLFLTRAGTTDEYPLTDAEIEAAAAPFGGKYRVTNPEFWFFQLLARHGWNNPRFHRAMVALDNAVARVFPRLARYSFVQQVWFEKGA